MQDASIPKEAIVQHMDVYLPVPITRSDVPNAPMEMPKIIITLRPNLSKKKADGIANNTYTTQ